MCSHHSDRTEAGADWDCTFLAKLWRELDRGAVYNWKVGPVAERKLRELIPSLAEELFPRKRDDLNAPELNKKLRALLGPRMYASDDASTSLAGWIVQDWGGIRKGDPRTISDWMKELGRFVECGVDAFIKAHDTRVVSSRIASWSKLLAFANSTKHAIYDARTSVGLSCALSTLGSRWRFFMPDSRNSAIKSARKRLLIHPPPTEPLGYRDYTLILERFVACKLSDSILAAEMRVFANAGLIAQSFIEHRK